MTQSITTAFQILAICAGLVWACPAAWAEKADRGKPMVIEADKPGTMDLQRQVVVFNGNVTISQGTMSLRAERIEVREAKTGERLAMVIGEANKPAAYRQRRDGANEWIEGSAERIEFDSRAETLKFSGQAHVRFLRGAELTDEVLGDSIIWNSGSGQISVVGGTPTAVNPSGRVRAVLAPRAEAAASAPSSVPSEVPTLKPSRSLDGDKK